jgi:siderophore synthetase component
VNPDTLTAQSLLNCLVREVSLPEEQAWESDGHLVVRLARSGRLLRLGASRRSAGASPRLTGDAALRRGETWHPVGWDELSALIAGELTMATGVPNDEFTAQVRDSHAAITAIQRARRDTGADGAAAGDSAAAGETDAANTGAANARADNAVAGGAIARYLASEQALVAGHRFHPAPKARSGDPAGWLPFAPEAGARFPLRFLAVRDEAFDADGDTTALNRLGAPAAPGGYRTLPAHPWQLRLLAQRPWLRRAFRDKVLIDLGAGSRAVVPTSSVRTVYDPAADVFCKFSLNVRITNCVRKNAWYELAGAVALTELLGPVSADLTARFPGAVVLGEPGYRTVTLPTIEAAEGLSVLAREGLGGCLAPGVTPLLAAALTEPPAGSPGGMVPDDVASGDPLRGGHASGLFDRRAPGWLLDWWEAYVRQVAPPVLHALFGHGIVFEPHLQNVLIGVDGHGFPAQAIFRDLEGVKLVTPRHDETLAGLKPEVAAALRYDEERGWYRVAYCLFVNHLAEVAAAIADRHARTDERFEAALWDRARAVLTGFARDHDWPPQLRALLAGVPLPAKANLRLRWARAADREAGYLSVRNPLGGRTAGPVARGGQERSC